MNIQKQLIDFLLGQKKKKAYNILIAFLHPNQTSVKSKHLWLGENVIRFSKLNSMNLPLQKVK